MAKNPGVISAAEAAKLFQLDLKNRSLAALLAWLVPGAGHLYQGRTAKGLLLMLCIGSTFLFGFYLGGGKVAYASPMTLKQAAQTGGPNLIRNTAAVAIDRWPFLCQAGIGTVALPALVERTRLLNGKGPLLGGWFYPPRRQGRFESTDSSGNTVKHPNELAQWNYEYGFYFELGTIYTVVAGLLNILAVYDAHSGPLVPVTAKEEDEGDASNEPAGDG